MKMEIPQGVCVQAGVISPDEPYEDRIVYRRKRLNRILLGLWFVIFFGVGFVPAALSQCFWAFILCSVVPGIGLVALVSELFGEDILHLYAQTGVFESRVGPWHRRTEFALSPDITARTDVHPKGGTINADMPVRELLIRKGKCEEARCGRQLPTEVLDFFAHCIEERVKGRQLVSGKGPWRLGIVHPFAFVLFALAILWCGAYGFSGFERIVVRNGAVEIVQSEWWGRRVTETKIPTKDIAYVGFKSTGTSRGGSSHCLLFLGKDNRLIKRIDGYKNGICGYQTGLMESIKCRPGTPFDRTRSTTTFFRFLALFLILPLALSCGLDGCCFYSKDSFGRTHYDWEEFPQPDVSGLKKRLQALKRRGGLRPKGS